MKSTRDRSDRRRWRAAEWSWIPLLAASALPIAQASAQDPTVPPAPMPAAAEEKKDPEPKKPPKPPEPVDVVIVPAFQALNLSGRRADYYHYHTPPSHLYLGLLQTLHRDAEGYPLQELWWRNLGADDQEGYLDAHTRREPSFVRFWRTTSRFYADPRLRGGAYSSREDTRALLRLKRFGSGPSLDLTVWDQEVTEPTIARLQPLRGIDYSANLLGLKATLPAGGGVLTFEPRHLTFDNHLNRLPGGDTTWLTGEYSHPVGDRANLSAAFDRITTHAGGKQTAVWNVLRLQGDVQASEGVFVDAYFRQRGVDLPFTRTDYLNRSTLAAIDVSAYPRKHTSIRGGLFREDLRRHEGLSGQEEHAAWNGGWARFRVSDPGRWALNLRFREKDLQNAPDAEITRLPSDGTLYYEHDRSVDGRLDFYPSQRLSAYLLYGWRDRDNGDRDTRLTLNTFTAGATAAVARRLNLSAELTQQFWDGNLRPLRAGGAPPPGGLPPRMFFSDARIFTASAGYELDRRSSLELSFNASSSTGGQSARDYLTTLEYRRTVSSSLFYSAGLQYECFRDSHLRHSYSALPVLLQVGYRKEFR